MLPLATHGFFFGDDCEEPAAETRGVAGARKSEPAAADSPAIENALLRSGLALAGFNHRADAPADAEDGVLTAQEVTSLDLSGVDWAVLSACDTSRGDVAAGEGVLGLQRAFRIAGARTLIMSLWSVDDAATRQWMRGLYRARRIEGATAADCARSVSLGVLEQRRRQGLSEHPFYWGAFVTTGAPGQTNVR
jgi:CHAT domain-containing protein